MEFNATFLVSAVSFILFTVIMNKIFYKPLAKIMADRKSYVDDTLAEAEYANNKANAIIKDRDDKLQKAIVESKEIIANTTNSANVQATELIKNAKMKSASDISKAKDSLNIQAGILERNLKPEIKVLAETISSKILGFDTKIEDIQ